MITINIDKQNKRIYYYNNGRLVLTNLWVPSYFCYKFDGDVTASKSITIYERDNIILYRNLLWFMDQSYRLGGESKAHIAKDEKRLVFTSDCMDLRVDQTPRLIIDKNRDSISISYSNPYREKNGYPLVGATIGLSPAGNGQFTENRETGRTLQDDLISVHTSTLGGKLLLKPKSKKD